MGVVEGTIAVVVMVAIYWLLDGGTRTIRHWYWDWKDR